MSAQFRGYASACPQLGPRLCLLAMLWPLALITGIAADFPLEPGSSEPPGTNFLPTIVRPPADQTAKLGDAVQFEVEASDPAAEFLWTEGEAPTLTYQWQFNGNNLEGATNAALVLAAVGCPHAGEYRVIVNNYLGAVSSPAATLLVTDPLPPDILCPPDITVPFTSMTGAVVHFGVVATNRCSAVQVKSFPLSGSTFPVGKSTVVSITRDASRKIIYRKFNVTVLGSQGVLSNVVAELRALRQTVHDSHTRDHLKEVIEPLEDALDEDLWRDDVRPDPEDGAAIFTQTKAAVGELKELTEDEDSTVPPAVLNGFIERILQADRLLVVTGIQDARRADIKHSDIAEAEEDLAKGDQDIADEDRNYDEGIDHYAEAWLPYQPPKPQKTVYFCQGRAYVQFVGIPEEVYRIEATTNFQDWETLTFREAKDDGRVVWEEADLTRFRSRFYRMTPVRCTH
jgi:hypothetical protein